MKRLALLMTGAEGICSDQEDLATPKYIENILQKKCLLTKIMTERAEPAEIWNTVCTRRCAKVLVLKRF